MVANQKAICFLSENENTFFEIPFYQRTYVWTQDNWEQLWDTMISKDNVNFLGSIILKDYSQPGDDIVYRSVIDGQQRLTTLSLLIRALIDEDIECVEDENDDLKRLLFNKKTIRTETGRKTELKIKINHSRINKEEYDKIIGGEYKNVDIHNLPNNASEMLHAYCFFRRKIKEIIDSKGKQEWIEIGGRIIDKLTISTRNSLVVITLQKEDNEQLIFDTINSAGVRLTCADIIKNDVFARLGQIDGKDNAGKFFEKSWGKTFEGNKELSDVWTSYTVIGKSNQRIYIELFLQAFAVVKNIYDPNEDRLEELAQKYKKYFEKITTTEELQNFIKVLCSWADCYKKYFIDEIYEINKHGIKYYDKEISKLENEIRHVLQILSFMNTSTCDAYVLQILNEEDEEINKVTKLQELKVYLIRNYIYEQRVDKNFNKEIAKVVRGEKTINDYIVKNNLTDDTIKGSLKKIDKNDPAKLILFFVELHRSYTGGSEQVSQVLDGKELQLEHIMPQKWEENWLLECPIVNQNGEELTEVEIKEKQKELKEKRNSFVYQIGNMTLLSGTKNKELSNVSFYKKKEGYVKNNGEKVKGYNDTSKFLITKDVVGCNDWDEKIIEERTERLSNEIIQLWKL